MRNCQRVGVEGVCERVQRETVPESVHNEVSGTSGLLRVWLPRPGHGPGARGGVGPWACVGGGSDLQKILRVLPEPQAPADHVPRQAGRVEACSHVCALTCVHS